MTFVVEIPSNTPTEDRIFFRSGPFVAIPMEQTGPTMWAITLTEEDLKGETGPEYQGAALESGVLHYAYEHGQGYLGGEFFPDDPVQEEWWIYRAAPFNPGAEQRDKVDRWRFSFPQGESPPSAAAALTDFVPRVAGMEFQAGIQVNDFWSIDLEPLLASTDVAIRRTNATWIQIAPAWDYGRLDPLPTIVGDSGTVPSYDDNALRRHIGQVKVDGFSVLLRVQVCCTPAPDTTSKDQAWWDEWYAQYESFVVHHARIAAEAQVDAILLDWSGHIALPGAPGAPVDAAERWGRMIAAMREVYGGPLGWDLLIGGRSGDYGEPWPWPNFRTIAHLFDFLGMSLWQGLADTTTPTQEELDTVVEAAFAASLDEVYKAIPLPQVLSSIAYASYDGGAMATLNVDDVALVPFFQEGKNVLTYDAVEQAMVFQAVMKAAARRPYIVGAYTFNYSYIAMPRAPDYSIRNKPAEQVVSEWYATAGVAPRCEASLAPIRPITDRPRIDGEVGTKVSLDAPNLLSPENGYVIYHWKQIFGELDEVEYITGHIAELSEATSEGASFIPPAPSNYRFQLTATDSDGASKRHDVDVRVAMGSVRELDIKGVIFADLFGEMGGPEFNSAPEGPVCLAEALDHAMAAPLRVGANWIGLASSAFYTQVSPRPVIGDHGNYLSLTDDEYFASLVGAATERGLKVMQIEGLSPGLDLSETQLNALGPMQNDPGWWDDWFTEWEKWLVPRAARAETHEVDMFVPYLLADDTIRPDVYPQYGERWREIITAIREVYSGTVAMSFVNVNESLNFIDAFDAALITVFDGMFISTDIIKDNRNPTMAELIENNRFFFSFPQGLIDAGMPMYYVLTVNSSDGQARSEEIEERATFQADFQEQALYYEAFFKTAAETPWVRGVFTERWDWFDQ